MVETDERPLVGWDALINRIVKNWETPGTEIPGAYMERLRVLIESAIRDAVADDRTSRAETRKKFLEMTNGMDDRRIGFMSDGHVGLPAGGSAAGT